MTGADRVSRGIATVAFMAVVSLVFIGGVSAVYIKTAPVIRRNETLAFKRSVLTAAGLPVPQDPDSVNAEFSSSLQSMGKDAWSINGSAATAMPYAGYVFRVTGAGLWGTITAMVGLESDLATVRGIDFVDQNETPGLGARISEPWFTSQFRGKKPPLSMVAEGTPDETAAQFDAVTGATITSTAVKDIVNRTVKIAPQMILIGREVR